MNFEEISATEEVLSAGKSNDPNEKPVETQEELGIKSFRQSNCDEEDAENIDRYQFDTDETDVAIVNDIAIVEDNPDLPVLTFRCLLTGLVS